MRSDKYSLKMVCLDQSRHPREQDCSVRASLRHSLVSHSRSSSSGMVQTTTTNHGGTMTIEHGAERLVELLLELVRGLARLADGVDLLLDLTRALRDALVGDLFVTLAHGVLSLSRL